MKVISNKKSGVNTSKITSNTLIIDDIGDITLDADGADIFMKDGGTTFGSLTNNSGNLIIKSGTTTAATFTGANVVLGGTIDNGTSNITTGGKLSIDIDSAQTINTSGGGIGHAGSITLGLGGDAGMYVSGDDLYIENKTSDNDIIFRANDGGTFTSVAKINGAAGRFEFTSGKWGDATTAVTTSAAELNILDEDGGDIAAGVWNTTNLNSDDAVLYYDAGNNKIGWSRPANVCFLKGTKITLADKSQKKIEDLCVGEMILTYQIKGLSNLKKDQKHEIMNWSQDTMNGTFRRNRIRNIWVNPTDRYIVINDKLRVTNFHIIHVKRDDEYKFLPAEKVQLGDKLFTDKGKYESITDIKQVSDKTEVYNIEVKKNKTYFAENYLVHHFCETCSGLSGRI